LRLFRKAHRTADAMAAALGAELERADPDAVAVWGTVVWSSRAARLAYFTSIVRDVADPSAGEPAVSAGDPGAGPAVHPAWLDLVYPSLAHAMRALDAHPALLSNLAEMPGMVLLIPQKKVRPDRATLNAWPRARIGDTMLALGVFYYLDRE